MEDQVKEGKYKKATLCDSTYEYGNMLQQKVDYWLPWAEEGKNG